ncbi:MAG: VWA domain-containing protein, partial [Spartobacteria bacterium]|nr:VWA domain-containing protein [Spartobacteria bacterium]
GVLPSAGVTIEASATGYNPGTVSVPVLMPTLSFLSAPFVMHVGDTVAGGLQRVPEQAQAALAVTLASGDTGVFTVAPASIIFSADSATAPFDLTGLAQGSAEITATLGAESISTTVLVVPTNPMLESVTWKDTDQSDTYNAGDEIYLNFNTVMDTSTVSLTSMALWDLLPSGAWTNSTTGAWGVGSTMEVMNPGTNSSFKITLAGVPVLAGISMGVKPTNSVMDTLGAVDTTPLPLALPSTESDTDGDGIPDWWEMEYFGSPTGADPYGDPDNDNLNNLNEYYAGTDPFDWDTGDTGENDGLKDSDMDGLTNAEEANVYFTHPGDPDTDDDTFTDGDELNPYVICGGRMITSPRYSRSPLVPRSMVLNGAALTIPDPDGTYLDRPSWAIDCYVMLTNATSTGNLICRRTDSGQTNFCLRVVNNVPVVEYTTPAGTRYYAGASNAIAQDTWTHLDAKLIPTNNTLSLGVDGVLFQAQMVAVGCARGKGQVTIGDAGLYGYIDSVSVGNPQPVDVVFVMDQSGSMIGERLEQLKNAAKKAIDVIPDGVPIALIGFESVATDLTEGFSTYKLDLKRKVDQLYAFGGTDYSNAVIAGADMVRNHSDMDRHIEIFISDGYPNEGTEPSDALIQQSAALGITINTIGFQIDDPSQLQRLSTLTGGTYYDAPTDEELEQAFADILSDLFKVEYLFDDGGVTAEDFEHRLDWDYAISGVTFSTVEYHADAEVDIDEDGIPDWWEELFFGGDADPNADPDEDGVINRDEYYLDMNPHDEDTNNNGIPDGAEDYDQDGLSNADESNLYKTDPKSPDTDGDGVPDGTEVRFDITHPLHPMSSTNYQERSLMLSAISPNGLNIPLPDRLHVGTNGWTVECWMYPQTDGSGTNFSLFSETGGHQFWVGLEDFRPKVEIRSGLEVLVQAGGTNATGSIQQLPPDEWSHLAYVWSPARNSLEVYVNGVLLIAQQTKATPDFSSGVGRMGVGFSDGYLDDIRFWNYDRSWQDLDYWSQRIYPAPEGYVQTPVYGIPLKLYYRFDDGGTNLVDFAFLNNADYFIPGANSFITTNQAVSLLGSDDEDGDLLPDWWAKLFNLDVYPMTNNGPTVIYFDKDSNYIARIEYFRTFRAYSSIGYESGWAQEYDNMFYYPKDRGLGADGRYSAYMKYVYLHNTPNVATLRLFTPGMQTAEAYVNGERVTATGDEGNPLQSIDLAGRLRTGRNMIYVRCESAIDVWLDEARTQPAPPTGNDNKYERAIGKFDASLACDGVYHIVRGDTSVGDPRAVWNVQTWSMLWHIQHGLMYDPLVPDRENRFLPGNQEFGLPFNADTDNLNAFYEYLCGTNPRDDDSDNNGIPDGLEDMDNDGLLNLEEQQRRSHPLLPDTDDDSLRDGADAVGDNDPASALNPSTSRSLALGGTAADYAEFPLQRRFALTNWSVEAWVRRAAGEADGGVIIQRQVGPVGLNYELGLDAANRPYVRYISTDGNEVIATNDTAVDATWIHLAGTYDSSRRELSLYTNGALVHVATDLNSPALYAGGPIVQRVGPGLQGSVDDVRIWAMARSEAQIAQNMEDILTGDESALIAYYRFDDDTSFQASPLIGTSANNDSTNALIAYMPWTWGQVQDFVRAYSTDWWNKWIHAASLHGNVAFSADGDGALVVPPSLRVNIEPTAAVDGGALWALLGLGSWRESGVTIYEGLSEGNHTILYKAVDGWTTPSNRVVSLTNGTITSITETYVQNGSVHVELTFIDEASHGLQWPVSNAQWRVQGRPWHFNGESEENVEPGSYVIEFNSIDGWLSPAETNIMVVAGESTLFIGQFEPAASLSVNLSPSQAVDEGAMWSIDAANWQESGATLHNLVPVTNLAVYFRSIDRWTAPATTNTPLQAGHTAVLNANYEPVLGTLRVFIEPPGARATGALWCVDSVCTNSGALIGGLPLGTNIVTFTDLSSEGWIAPDPIAVHLTNDMVTLTTGRYIRVGGICVELLPAEVVASGATWRVLGGAWYDSAETNLVVPGTYTLEFGQVSDWFTPASMEVEIGEEIEYLQVQYYSELGDFDGDGLSNREEVEEYNTDPGNPDTDGDGVIDYNEVKVDQTHPLHPMSSTNYWERSLDLSIATNGYAIPLPPSIDPDRFNFATNGWSVECWFWPGSDGDGEFFTMGEVGAGSAIRTGLEDYRPLVEIYQATNTAPLIVAGGTNLPMDALSELGYIQQVPTNEWSHLSFVWSPDRNSLEVFINGVLLIAQKSYANPSMGASQAWLCNGFTNGHIDEVRVWNYDRSWEQISYWANRLVPAPWVNPDKPDESYIEAPEYAFPYQMQMYYRFDDGSSNIVDFAYLNNRDYFIENIPVTAMVNNRAMSLIGTDDEDGDILPEWWVELNDLNDYSETVSGPTFLGDYSTNWPAGAQEEWFRHFASGAEAQAAKVRYFNSFTAYGSIGNVVAYADPIEGQIYAPVDRGLGHDARHCEFLKYVYLDSKPLQAELEIFTPGMEGSHVWVNGEYVTATDTAGDEYQSIRVESHLHVGRNMIYVRCTNTFEKFVDIHRTILGTFRISDDFPQCYFERANGKFDARLTCDNVQRIVRGDQTKYDPRAVWHVHAWSTLWQEDFGLAGRADKDGRQMPANQDYGIPFNNDTDSLNAYYEFLCLSNPNDADSNNNGVPDDLEDLDQDGLVNGQEQVWGSHPRLPDTDDDGLYDGPDFDPSDAMSKGVSYMLTFPGTTNDYVQMPYDRRFGLDSWTLEAWVSASDSNGGVIVQREVGPNGLNFELGLSNGLMPYVKYRSIDSNTVCAAMTSSIGTNWVHLAGVYDSSRRELKLFTNGVMVAEVEQTVSSPAIFAGGSVRQRIGYGYNGNIDDVRIWSGARTELQIQNNLDKTLEGTEIGLVAYYAFDDGTSYQTNPVIGTSANNDVPSLIAARPWAHGQVQDFVQTYAADAWNKWIHCATIRGDVRFTTNNTGNVKFPTSVMITLHPEESVTDGAQWAIQGVGFWRESGELVYQGITAGTNMVLFKSIDGWTEPSAQQIFLSNEVVNTFEFTYQQNGGLHVLLTFLEEAIHGQTWPTTGAQWRVNGMDWRYSGQTIDNLSPAAYSVNYRDIDGWVTPPNDLVPVVSGDTTLHIAQYRPANSIQINITQPEGAVWRIQPNMIWQQSGDTVINLDPGTYSIVFADLYEGWIPPAPTNITVNTGEAVYREIAYTRGRGTLQVNIEPPGAVAAGAVWNVTNDTWHPSGSTVDVDLDVIYAVTFTNLLLWDPPDPVVVTLSGTNTVEITGEYTYTGNLDPDNDGLNNAWELYIGSDPYDAYSLWTSNGSVGVQLNDGQWDSDGDGLSNLDEVNNYMTDPMRIDTDEDGVNDQMEIHNLTHPLHPMSSTNYAERSLDISVRNSVALQDADRFLVRTNGWTVECWIYPETDGNGELFSLGQVGSHTSFRVGLENYRPIGRIYLGTNTEPMVVAGGTNLMPTANPALGTIQQLPVGEWSHVAYVWAPERNSFEVYINGLLLIAQEKQARPDFADGPAMLLENLADGYLDEIRVWDYARTRTEISYWHNRLVPAPWVIDISTYAEKLVMYYRFDDDSTNLVDFAHMPKADDRAGIFHGTNYFIAGPVSMTTSNPAVALIGMDDEDGDGLPEWWTEIHDLDKYPDYSRGPRFIYGLIKDCFYNVQMGYLQVYTNYFVADDDYAARVEFFKCFRAFSSVGSSLDGGYGWYDPTDDVYYAPKSQELGVDGLYSTYLKYVSLGQVPQDATLNLFTPGMTQTVAYINGERVTLAGDETNNYQQINVINYLKVGRNMIYIYCESGYHRFLDEGRQEMAAPDYNCNHFKGVYGKFDANLICDGATRIVRGDHSRNDPRAVWYCQTWSTYEETMWDPPYRDKEDRVLPGNQDYGLPLNADSDGLTAYYEFFCRTNPRDDDSDNNGVPDGLEDYDSDGLLNIEEQQYGSSPALPDTDDDGVRDGLDTVGDNNPISPLTPINSRALELPGQPGDYAEMPMQSRFALTNWTIEAWVRLDVAEVDGGVVLKREVGPNGVNYEMGLGDGVIAPVNVPYVRYTSISGVDITTNAGGPAVSNAWVHMASSYDASRRELKLYVNGTNIIQGPATSETPAMYAGGPVIQRMGEGIHGYIDEARIWSVVRSAEQIQQHNLTTIPMNTENLVAYYRFDDGSSYDTNTTPVRGVSANNIISNGPPQEPWIWGQIQDYVSSYSSDWWDKWTHCATLRGNASFTSNGLGRLDNPPMLRVTIFPPEVVAQGARWRLADSGVWHDNGYVLTDGLDAGPDTIIYLPVPGWSTPDDTQIILSNNLLTSVDVTYTQNGLLEVQLSPAAAVLAGAQWRVDGGEWQNSGAVVADLTPGQHYVEFRDIAGWTIPEARSVTITSGSTTTLGVGYVLIRGSMTAIIEPLLARVSGGMWRIGTNEWSASGVIVSDLPFGSHTVEFLQALPWVPASTTMTVNLTSTDMAVITNVYELSNNGNDDFDGDGLIDRDELMVYGTDPRRVDTDADGVSDGHEVHVDITHPLQPMSSANYAERSLDLSVINNISLYDADRFSFGTNGWTVESWIYPQTDGDGWLFAMGQVGVVSSLRAGLENYRPKAEIFIGTNTTAAVTVGGVGAVGSIQQLPADDWSHVAYVWAPQRNSFEIFVNGVLLIAQITLTSVDFPTSTATLVQGFADGYIDDVRVWDYDRTAGEVTYWHNRLFPSPTEYVQTPSYGMGLQLYYRFDDGITNLVDYAHLPRMDNFFAATNYYIHGPANATVTAPAVSLLGSDDQDGDALPDWWVDLHNLNLYPTSNIGPTFLYFQDNSNKVARFEYFRTFRAYGSIGNKSGWAQDKDNVRHMPKDGSLGDDGDFSVFMKYVYLHELPGAAELELFTPAMASTIAYVNGIRVTAVGDETNQMQLLDVTPYVQMGRNMVYVRCLSEVDTWLDEARTIPLPDDVSDNHFVRAVGKFDAQLTCDGVAHIVRGDLARNDPRSVWYGQTWSMIWQMTQGLQGDPVLPDKENHTLPGNMDYGVPFDSDSDSLNAFYEYWCDTNPRDDDSDNNGIPDALEDFDGDGLPNLSEQVVGAHPRLPDTDDDGLLDNEDPSPSSSASTNARAMVFGGTAADYVSLPIQRRFALTNWTIETWVSRDASEADGGVILEREVGPMGLNYELGLGDGSIAGVNVPYARFISVEGDEVIATNNYALPADTWTHIGGRYDWNARRLTLLLNGTNAAFTELGGPTPALFAGGPVVQRMGAGFNGMIDEVRIWNTANSASYVQSNFNRAVRTDAPGLVAYYRFDDGTSYSDVPPVRGTSRNNLSSNGLPVEPWTWGQMEDYVTAYDADWWSKWHHGATMHGDVTFTTNGGGAIGNPPMLQVIIDEPFGARWTLSGFSQWYNSGFILSDGLSTGAYTVLFAPTNGWTSPAPVPVLLSNDTLTIVHVSYQNAIQYGQLQVFIEPPEVNSNGAVWAVDTDQWYSNGVVIAVETGVTYNVVFTNVPPWTTPDPIMVTITGTDLVQVTGTYVYDTTTDSDGDGLPDAWEVYIGSDPYDPYSLDPSRVLNDGQWDSDNDGLDNETEVRTHGSDPIRQDTDMDGVPDGREVKLDITHPVHPMSSTNYMARSLDMSVLNNVIIPDSSRFAFGTNGWMVEAWVLPVADDSGWIFSVGQVGAETSLRVGYENYRPKVEIYSGTNTVPDIYAGGVGAFGSIQPLPIDGWTHVAYAWAPARNSLEVYVNGVLLIAQNTLASFNFNGTRPTLADGLSDGFIDEIRVWDYARSWEDVTYWHKRFFPAPAGYVHTPSYGRSLRLYYRFDDASTKLVDFARLPIADDFFGGTNYFIDLPPNATPVKPAVIMQGSDDEDGDLIPEWWAELNNLDVYPEHNTGPLLLYFDEDYSELARIAYYKSFHTYTSVGGYWCWSEPESGMWY